MRLFMGDDWAEDHHDVEVMNEEGQVLAKARLMMPDSCAPWKGTHFPAPPSRPACRRASSPPAAARPATATPRRTDRLAKPPAGHPPALRPVLSCGANDISPVMVTS
jgi:hypothetical protein